MASSDLIESLSASLWLAEQTQTPIETLTSVHPHLTHEDAYAIQAATLRLVQVVRSVLSWVTPVLLCERK